MYDRFTDRARKVMQLANQEAHRFNHEYIGTEHVIIGLCKEGSGNGCQILRRNEIGTDSVIVKTRKIVQPGPHMITMGKLPKTPRTKKVIEYAMEDARRFKHNHVGTEHLLLGLTKEREGVASEVLLNNFGFSYERAVESFKKMFNIDVVEESMRAKERYESLIEKHPQGSRVVMAGALGFVADIYSWSVDSGDTDEQFVVFFPRSGTKETFTVGQFETLLELT